MSGHERALTTSDVGTTFAAAVRATLDGLSWRQARELVTSGRVYLDGVRVQDPAARVEGTGTLRVEPTARRRRKGVLDPERIVFSDRDVVIVQKAAGLLSVPYDDADRDTLVDQTQAALRRSGKKQGPPLGVVQRLDKDTTGLLVFARNVRAKKRLQNQFRAHTVHRRYLALVHGELRPDRRTFETHLVRDRGDGLRGSYGVFRRPRGPTPKDARRAVTHVRLIERLRGASLVECRLETGRQHQIRIHLSEAGHPLIGERVYIRGFEGPRIDAPRPMLHAAELGFVHPSTEAEVRFAMDPPPDFQDALERLR